MSTETIDSFLSDPDVRSLIGELRAARIDAAQVRAHVDSIIAPVFAAFEFWSEARPARNGRSARPSRRIEHPRDLYLVGDAGLASPQMDAFEAASHAALRAAGYDVEYGYCPALIAEVNVITMENALVEMATARGFFGRLDRIVEATLSRTDATDRGAQRRVLAQLGDGDVQLLAISDTKIGCSGPLVTVVYESSIREGIRCTTCFHVTDARPWTGCWMTEADALALQSMLPNGDTPGTGAPAWVGRRRTPRKIRRLAAARADRMRGSR